MLPFSFSGKGDKAAADMERALDEFVQTGITLKQAARRAASVPRPKIDKDVTAGSNNEPKKRLPPAGTWTITPHTTKKGVSGRVVRVGSFSAWIAKGDTVKEEACVTAMSTVFRSDVCQGLADAIRNGSMTAGSAPAIPKKRAPPPGTWTIAPHTTKKGVRGRVVRVGPFSAWIAKGDTVKAEACVTAIIEVFRSKVCEGLAATIRSGAVS